LNILQSEKGWDPVGVHSLIGGGHLEAHEGWVRQSDEITATAGFIPVALSLKPTSL
jgi:hypothetical protein